MDPNGTIEIIYPNDNNNNNNNNIIILKKKSKSSKGWKGASGEGGVRERGIKLFFIFSSIRFFLRSTKIGP